MKSLFRNTLGLIFLASCASGPITATGIKVGDTEGRACMRNILGFIPLSSDSSIYTAAKNGKITNISTVDRELKIYIVYNENCTVVRGWSK